MITMPSADRAVHRSFYICRKRGMTHAEAYATIAAIAGVLADAQSEIAGADVSWLRAVESIARGESYEAILGGR